MRVLIALDPSRPVFPDNELLATNRSPLIHRQPTAHDSSSLKSRVVSFLRFERLRPRNRLPPQPSQRRQIRPLIIAEHPIVREREQQRAVGTVVLHERHRDERSVGRASLGEPREHRKACRAFRA